MNIKNPILLPPKYSYKNKTFFSKEKDDWRDRIDVEVGDSKQIDKFHPQIKVMRWDNEVNVSIRLTDFDIEDANIEYIEDKIILENDQIRIEYYTVNPCKKHVEGGYEFNLILKEKPKNNIINFSLQSKGVDFLYQDILSQFNLGRKISSESLLSHGSYEIRLSEERINYTNKKIYRTGKVGHIFKPLIKDSTNNQIYGEIVIDQSKGLLQIIIPQDFLDKATYPVYHSTGLTFGYTTLSSSAGDYGYTGCLYGSIGSVTADGTVDSITAGVGSYNATSTGFKAVVTNSSKAILTNGVGGTASTSDYGPEWKTASYSTKPSVSNGSSYFACIVTQNDNLYIFAGTGGSTSDFIQDTSNNYTTPTNPTDASGKTSKWDIYATYTASGGGATAVKPLRTLLGVGT